MIRRRLAAWRYRLALYSRRRWTDGELSEIETGVMGAAVLVALMAVLIVWGRG